MDEVSFLDRFYFLSIGLLFSILLWFSLVPGETRYAEKTKIQKLSPFVLLAFVSMKQIFYLTRDSWENHLPFKTILMGCPF